ncbi:ammonium transporter [Clostridia bacterium]|nr:ammonium transporter [Clostridia bacterium]
MPLNTGNTAFMLICAALVFIMTPGLGFFYGGLGRRKNMVNNLMASTAILGLGSVLWMLVGYSLAFSGNSLGGLVGDFHNFGLSNIGVGDLDDNGLPVLVTVGFQMTFALITPALITGAIAGRMKFKSLFIFIAFWSIIVYYPMAHMVWGGGLLGGDAPFADGTLGSVDFAGGNVVHISSGITALVLCILLGKRRGYERSSYHIHNVPFVLLGAALLWFGWYGFNAGSAGAADGLAAHAFMTTSVSAGAALLSWMLIDVIKSGKPTLVGASTGAVVGLVAITPGAGFVPIWAALIIGLLVSPICFFAVSVVKKAFHYDDALDVFGCHGVGGIFGGICTGLFADPNVNGTTGLLFGDPKQFAAQVVSILFTIVFAGAGAFVCYGLTRLFGKIRVSPQEEAVGLDASQHGEEAYPSFSGLDNL